MHRGKCTYTAGSWDAARCAAYRLERVSSSRYERTVASYGSMDDANVRAVASGVSCAWRAKRASNVSDTSGSSGLGYTAAHSDASHAPPSSRSRRLSSSWRANKSACSYGMRSGAKVASSTSVSRASSAVTCSAYTKSLAMFESSAPIPGGSAFGALGAGMNENSTSKSDVSIPKACATSVRCTN